MACLLPDFALRRHRTVEESGSGHAECYFIHLKIVSRFLCQFTVAT